MGTMRCPYLQWKNLSDAIFLSIALALKVPGHFRHSLEDKVIHRTDISAKIALLKEIDGQTSAIAQRDVLPNDNFGKIDKYLTIGPRKGKKYWKSNNFGCIRRQLILFWAK